MSKVEPNLVPAAKEGAKPRGARLAGFLLILLPLAAIAIMVSWLAGASAPPTSAGIGLAIACSAEGCDYRGVWVPEDDLMHPEAAGRFLKCPKCGRESVYYVATCPKCKKSYVGKPDRMRCPDCDVEPRIPEVKLTPPFERR